MTGMRVVRVDDCVWIRRVDSNGVDITLVLHVKRTTHGNFAKGWTGWTALHAITSR